jgi:DNA-binding CsgD family transcriptional regulator
MAPLSQNDCLALLSAIETVHGIKSLDQYPAGVFAALKKVLSCNTICYNEVALPDRIESWLMEPAGAMPGPILRDSFMRNFTEHPALVNYARTGDSSASRISDFLSRRQFHDLTLYNEYYRQSSVEYELTTTFMLGPGRLVGIALDRHCKDFTENERLALDLLRPHLAQAYSNVQALEMMKRVIEGGGRKIVIVSRSGEVRLAGDDVRRLMAKYFDVSPFWSSLPDGLNRWITHERALLDEGSDVPSPPVPMVVSKNGCRLTVRFIWGGHAAGQDLLLMEEELVGYDIAPPDGSGLTERENEILAWLSQGKTNREIAQALSISPRTVKKHLEHIYGKLMVHRRSAAVARLYHL